MKNRLGKCCDCNYKFITIIALGLTMMSFIGSTTTEHKDFNDTECPTARYTINNSIVIINTEITFINQSEHATSYNWDFGDGNSSLDIQPNHIYQNAGTYQVTLTATSEACSDFFIGVVDVVGM